MTFWARCDPNGAGLDHNNDRRGDLSSRLFEIDTGFDTGTDTGMGLGSNNVPPGSNGLGSAALECLFRV